MKYSFIGKNAISANKEYEVLSEHERIAGKASFGFITENSRNRFKRLSIPELNSGFSENESCIGYPFTKLVSGPFGVLVSSEDEFCRNIPFTFAADLPREGNYLVSVTVTATEDFKDGMIFTGRRHLAVKKDFKKGEVYTGHFPVNVCPFIPRYYTEVMTDETLDITVFGQGLALTGIEVSEFDGKTLYIAGDSTLTDQNTTYPYSPAQSYSGWGQIISAFMGESMAVSNHAHSGLTTSSFRSEGHYGILLDRIKPGDYCLFQFGHNDQKLVELKAYEGYAENLNRYIDEILEKKAIPVIVSPLCRNSWRGDGTYNDMLEEYGNVCRDIAEKRNVPFVDLHKLSLDFIVKNGRESARAYFFPSDYTHSNDFGAYLFAGYVYSELAKNGIVKEKDIPAWIPPEIINEIHLPKMNKALEPAKEATVEKPDEPLSRADALSMVISTMKFFPTNVYNDYFDDVVGHETYAGCIECAYQNGIVPAKWVAEKKINPEKPVLFEEFMEMLKAGYAGRRPEKELSEILKGIEPEFGKTLSRQHGADICTKIKV